MYIEIQTIYTISIKLQLIGDFYGRHQNWKKH